MIFLGIIPARYDSKRFPGKPLADIKGKPMIQRVYEQASQVLEHIVVATDDIRISKVVEKFGGKVIMTSKDHESGTDRCVEAYTKYISNENIKFDVVINIQGDEPFIQPNQIELLKTCFDDKDAQIGTLVKQIDDNEDIFNPNKPKVVLNKKGEAIYFSRSPIPFIQNVANEKWHTKHSFYKHIGIYAYRTDILSEITQLPQSSLEIVESLEQLRWIENGYKIKVAETDYEGISIDTKEDLENLLTSLK